MPAASSTSFSFKYLNCVLCETMTSSSVICAIVFFWKLHESHRRPLKYKQQRSFFCWSYYYVPWKNNAPLLVWKVLRIIFCNEEQKTWYPLCTPQIWFIGTSKRCYNKAINIFPDIKKQQVRLFSPWHSHSTWVCISAHVFFAISAHITI